MSQVLVFANSSTRSVNIQFVKILIDLIFAHASCYYWKVVDVYINVFLTLCSFESPTSFCGMFIYIQDIFKTITYSYFVKTGFSGICSPDCSKPNPHCHKYKIRKSARTFTLNCIIIETKNFWLAILFRLLC